MDRAFEFGIGVPQIHPCPQPTNRSFNAQELLEGNDSAVPMFDQVWVPLAAW